ncbi:MAG: hypothetical protein K2X32_08465, partial [Phycisphaerales bacterium]|nr:hypothetical protein [Phycisphaerales bacterium]
MMMRSWIILSVALLGGGRCVAAPGDSTAPAPASPTPSIPTTPTSASPVAPPTRVVPVAGAARVRLALRSSQVGVEGDLVGVSGAGLVLRVAAADGVLQDKAIGWDTVRTVDGAGPTAMTFLQVGEQIWRGRTRIERGDFVLGERVIEPLYASLVASGREGTSAQAWPGLTGPTGAVLAEAALRCRLNRGWTTAALEPWLAWRASVEEAGRLGGVIVSPGSAPPGQQVWIGGQMSGVGVTDATTGLCVQLPPIFSAAASERALPAIYALGSWGAAQRRAGSTGELAMLYRAAIAGEMAQSAGRVPDPVSTELMKSADPGVRLCAEIVVSRLGTAAQRAEARSLLRQRLAVSRARPAESEAQQMTLSSWQESWVRAAIGRSLLLETDLKSKREALVSLLHVPARFGDQVPWLAAICLREAIQT